MWPLNNQEFRFVTSGIRPHWFKNPGSIPPERQQLEKLSDNANGYEVVQSEWSSRLFACDSHPNTNCVEDADYKNQPLLYTNQNDLHTIQNYSPYITKVFVYDFSPSSSRQLVFLLCATWKIMIPIRTPQARISLLSKGVMWRDIPNVARISAGVRVTWTGSPSSTTSHLGRSAIWHKTCHKIKTVAVVNLQKITSILIKVTKRIKIAQSKQELCQGGVTSHTNSPRQVVRFREQGAQWGSQIAGHRYCSRHTQIAGDESPNVEVWEESQQCVESKQWDRTEQRSCQPLFEWHTLWWLPP